MARTARTRSSTGIYHVVVRGVNRQDIFLEDEDRWFYLNNLRQLRSEEKCSLYGYCLMSNHVHLLVREQQPNAVSKLMHRLGTIFAQWYNLKYDRVGHVFQDRYHSSPVEDDDYLLTVLHYIHQNPVKAQLVERCGSFPFSSYHAYALAKDPFGIADIDLAVGLAGCPGELIRLFNSPAGELRQSRSKTWSSDDAEVLAT
ncbi:MAG: REP-associated tyrosine transposase, partial [Bacillota bacterium]